MPPVASGMPSGGVTVHEVVTLRPSGSVPVVVAAVPVVAVPVVAVPLCRVAVHPAGTLNPVLTSVALPGPTLTTVVVTVAEPSGVVAGRPSDWPTLGAPVAAALTVSFLFL